MISKTTDCTTPHDYSCIAVYSKQLSKSFWLLILLEILRFRLKVRVLYNDFHKQSSSNILKSTKFSFKRNSLIRQKGIWIYCVKILGSFEIFFQPLTPPDFWRGSYLTNHLLFCFFFFQLIHRMKMSSLEDEAGESTTNTRTFNRPSIDITSTCGYATEMGRERYVDASSANGSVNTLCVYQNGDAGLSPAPSPKPPTKFQEISPKTLEDWGYSTIIKRRI